jgi:hypothetical protein
MFTQHPYFRQPEDTNVKVWRYIDFTKFAYLLESRSLFFSRADKFEDPFEGSYPSSNIALRSQMLSMIAEPGREQWKRELEKNWALNKVWPKYHAINCWHMNEHESAAMWKLYLKSEEGIAIQSTYLRLKESFLLPEPIYLGIMSYVDYDRDIIADSNTFSPFLHKRKSFEHEREVRAIVTKVPISEQGIDFNVETMHAGLDVPVDLIRLVEKIYVARRAPTWFADLVGKVIMKYGYDFEVAHSRIFDKALF